MTSLNLAGNQLTDEFIDDFIVHVLPNLKSLTSLNMGAGSNLSSQSIQHLAPHLKKLTSLIYFGVDKNTLDAASKTALSELKAVNPKLQITDGIGIDPPRPIDLNH